MAKVKLSDYLVKCLNSLGIEEIFGLPGDYNFELVEAVERVKNVNWIGSTNELNAGYAADGYARIKGYGAIITTFGVGELSAINAVAGSMAENVPVIKIVGTPSSNFIKNKILLHHNLDNADYHAFEKAYSNVVETTAFLTKENAKEEIKRILNVMVKTKKPVYVAIPMDVAVEEVEDDFEILKVKSDLKNLTEAVDLIIKKIKASKQPVIVGDVLINRFRAKEEYLDFLNKTNIPSATLLRGMDLYTDKNYLGVYVSKTNNEMCYDYVNSSDCIILAGTVLSDLNTSNFNYKFKKQDCIDIQPNKVIIGQKVFENILIKDVFERLNQKIQFKFDKTLKEFEGYKKTELLKEEPLKIDYFYEQIEKFIKENDILITEVGLVPHGVIPMKLPKNVTVQNQMLWGSIGWATGATLGSCLADKKRRTVLITGEGAHQLTAQEIATMMRHNLKPVIFVINNGGYTVERILCDNINYKYNEISSWNYSMLPYIFEGNCFSLKVKTNAELHEALKIVQEKQKDKLCYIEVITNPYDIPKNSHTFVKHPGQLKGF